MSCGRIAARRLAVGRRVRRAARVAADGLKLRQNRHGLAFVIALPAGCGVVRRRRMWAACPVAAKVVTHFPAQTRFPALLWAARWIASCMHSARHRERRLTLCIFIFPPLRREQSPVARRKDASAASAVTTKEVADEDSRAVCLRGQTPEKTSWKHWEQIFSMRKCSNQHHPHSGWFALAL